MERMQKFIDYIIYLLLMFYTFIDCVSGFFAMHGLPSLSVPYKMFLILLMTLNIKFYKGILFYTYIFALIFVCLCHYLFLPNTDLGTSLAMLLRIIMAPFLFLYISHSYDSRDPKLFNICKINLFVMIGNLLLGVLGLGTKTYGYSDDAFGFKGFIIDGNSLAVTIFVLYVFFLLEYPQKKVKFTVLFLVMGILVCTKVSILAIILFGFYYYLRTTPTRKKIPVFIFLGAIATAGVIFILNSDFFAFQIWRIKHLMKLYNGNYLSVILSGRDVKLLDHYDFFNKNFSLSNLLFGYGFLNVLDIIELDLFDTFFSYGLLFFIAVVSFYIFCFYKNRRNKEVTFFNLLYLAICMTSGHIWFNTMSALFFSIINFYFSGDRKNEKYLLHN